MSRRSLRLVRKEVNLGEMSHWLKDVIHFCLRNELLQRCNEIIKIG